ncbi:hypothetical protein CAEBREN_03789 [Caenorhabditis brenneri]|uniref:Uncharacterized protein n=1 Tax=Caenorhabditis brenneri TaxID=135651 RepID=G0NHL0_CAEBE|nr:hypothetical protein CAEBREN_03789 [Caenorhabditis brenneri]
MAAVFSVPLATHASKVVTRHSKPVAQTPKPAYHTPKPQAHFKPINQSTKSITTNKSLPGGKWKRSIDEALMDSESSQRTPTDDLEPLPKNPRVDSPEDDQVRPNLENRKRYLGEKAATVDFPSKEQAEICPKYLFEEPALIIHMCLDCRIASRQLEMNIVDKENQQLVVNLCSICRATIKAQRRVKFFQHDILCFKRRELREPLKDKTPRKDLKKFTL